MRLPAVLAAVLLQAVWAAGTAAPASDAGDVASAVSTTSAAMRGVVARAANNDPRLLDRLYSADEVYRLPGYVGYEIDLEFQGGEHFVGVGAGDVQGLAFAAQGNHLFIKPRGANVRTNLTVLTDRRTYHFDYQTVPHGPDPDHTDVVYALRFIYPEPQASPMLRPAAAIPSVAQLLAQSGSTRLRNRDYWYCGRIELRPLSAWDDGVQTHLRFAARAELPALFLRNDDGSESLLNFHVEQDEIVIHGIARRFILRRGKLSGCIVNKGFSGSGAALPTGTLSPRVERAVRGSDDASR